MNYTPKTFINKLAKTDEIEDTNHEQITIGRLSVMPLKTEEFQLIGELGS